MTTGSSIYGLPITPPSILTLKMANAMFVKYDKSSTFEVVYFHKLKSYTNSSCKNLRTRVHAIRISFLFYNII
jgi:hypothetical protein